MMSQQKGVFRVNCIDCLDRTNVVEVIPISSILFVLVSILIHLYSPRLLDGFSTDSSGLLRS